MSLSARRSATRRDLYSESDQSGAAIAQQLDNCKDSFLYIAAKGGNTDEVEGLLDIGADCNWVNPVTRESPLLEACRQGHSQVVSLLLSRNAKLGPMPGTGVTPLHCACAHGHEEVALLLLSFGCDANIEDCSGLSCYEMADKNGHQDLAARLKRMQAQLCDHSNRKSPRLPSLTQARNTESGDRKLEDDDDERDSKDVNDIREEGHDDIDVRHFGHEHGDGMASESSSLLNDSLSEDEIDNMLAIQRQMPRDGEDNMDEGSWEHLVEQSKRRIENLGLDSESKYLDNEDSDVLSRHEIQNRQHFQKIQTRKLRASMDNRKRDDRFTSSGDISEAQKVKASRCASSIAMELANVRIERDLLQQDLSKEESKAKAVGEQAQKIWQELQHAEDELRTHKKATTELLQYKADPAELERMELPALQELEVALQQSLKVVTARKEKEIMKMGSVKQQQLCVICQTNKKTVLLLPCRHLCLCHSCSIRPELDSKCPLCRNDVDQKLDVYS